METNKNNFPTFTNNFHQQQKIFQNFPFGGRWRAPLVAAINKHLLNY